MYDFQNASVEPRAVRAFYNPPLDAHEALEWFKAARCVDAAMGILKRCEAEGIMSEHDYDELLDNTEHAIDILSTLGCVEDHEYIEELNDRADTILDTSNIDVTDDAADVAPEEAWLFGADEE